VRGSWATAAAVDCGEFSALESPPIAAPDADRGGSQRHARRSSVRGVAWRTVEGSGIAIGSRRLGCRCAEVPRHQRLQRRETGRGPRLRVSPSPGGRAAAPRAGLGATSPSTYKGEAERMVPASTRADAGRSREEQRWRMAWRRGVIRGRRRVRRCVPRRPPLLVGALYSFLSISLSVEAVLITCLK
jgi:hypothetical protein